MAVTCQRAVNIVGIFDGFGKLEALNTSSAGALVLLKNKLNQIAISCRLQ